MIVNPFESDAYNMYALTQAINILPNNYGKLQQMNLMPGKGVRSRNVIVEEKNGVLNLLDTMPPGSPGQQNKLGKRTVRSFVIPHIPVEDVILPAEFDGLRAFGSESETEVLASIMNDHLQTLKNKFAITREYHRMGALKGIVYDSDASSVIYNFYTEFGISQKTIDFALTSTSTNVLSKCLETVRHIEDNLKGDVMTRVHCLCSEGFFDALVAHTNVKAAYANYQEAAQRMGGDMRSGFVFGGITFEEYRGTATDKDGNARPFITANEAHFFPVGTFSTFATLYAPGDFLETVNTPGIEIYVKQEARKFNKGIDLFAESNSLPICYRPGVLVRGTKSS